MKVLLVSVFGRHELHVCPRKRSTNGFCGVVAVRPILEERRDVSRRDCFDHMAQSFELALPPERTCAGIRSECDR